MTGPEHYAAANALLNGHNEMTNADRFAAAQVHATLALAAATAYQIPEAPKIDEQWHQAGAW